MRLRPALRQKPARTLSIALTGMTWVFAVPHPCADLPRRSSIEVWPVGDIVSAVDLARTIQ